MLQSREYRRLRRDSPRTCYNAPSTGDVLSGNFYSFFAKVMWLLKPKSASFIDSNPLVQHESTTGSQIHYDSGIYMEWTFIQPVEEPDVKCSSRTVMLSLKLLEWPATAAVTCMV